MEVFHITDEFRDIVEEGFELFLVGLYHVVSVRFQFVVRIDKCGDIGNIVNVGNVGNLVLCPELFPESVDVLLPELLQPLLLGRGPLRQKDLDIHTDSYLQRVRVEVGRRQHGLSAMMITMMTVIMVSILMVILVVILMVILVLMIMLTCRGPGSRRVAARGRPSRTCRWCCRPSAPAGSRQLATPEGGGVVL